MYEHLRGRLIRKLATQAVVETGGVGYCVNIPLSTYKALPEPGDEVFLLTRLVVREDRHDLYGFATDTERRLFAALLQVSGIGPRLAQLALSGTTVDRLVAAIADGDVKALTAVKGIGLKTAQRMILELKDRIGEPVATAEPPAVHGVREEAIQALMALGSNRPEASTAVERASRGAAATPLEELVRRALGHL